MFIELLNRLAKPNHSRDHIVIFRVARDLKGLLLLSPVCLSAGAFGVISWNTRHGQFLFEVAGAALIIGILHASSAIRRLQREMDFRTICRRKRLALSPTLAAGIAAAERREIPQTAEAICYRLRMKSGIDAQSLAIFDVLLADIFSNSPTFQQALREWGEHHRRKA